MTDLQLAAEQYLATRRAVGSKLTHVEPLLFDFVRFARSRNATHVTCELALRWATQPEGATPAWWKSRMCVVRCFARYLSAIDPATQLPPTDLLPRQAAGSNRAEPYLYSDAEVIALLDAARSIRSALTAATCETLIGLLAVTGMRVGEALRLDRDDLDIGRGVLIVRDSKFTRSREVPLHESTLAALHRYGRLRDLHRPTPRSPSLFISRSGGRLSYRTMNWHFDRLVRKAGLQPRSDRCRPRMHVCLPHLAGLVPRRRRGPTPVAAVVNVPRSRRPELHVLVPVRADGSVSRRGQPAGVLAAGAGVTSLAPILEAFFTDRLITQRRVSPHTVNGLLVFPIGGQQFSPLVATESRCV